MERLKLFNESRSVVEDYMNHEHIRGTVDCNLMILKIFEPENYAKMVGKYNTIIGGVRVSNKTFGVKSLAEWLKGNDDYIVVKNGFQTKLDIIVFEDRHDIFLNLGTKWFGVKNDNVFGFVDNSVYDKDDYIIYRKVK